MVHHFAHWDVYAHELTPLNYGHPLWYPEPDGDYGEIRIGDVGYLKQGKFMHLFNCLAVKDVSTHNTQRLLPPGFKPFQPPLGPIEQSVRTINAAIDAPCVLLRRDRKQRKALVRLSGFVGSALAGCKRAEDSAAALSLKLPANRTFLECDELIRRYVKENVCGWTKWAKSTRYISLKEEDVIFVYGHTKTPLWDQAVCITRDRGAQLEVSAEATVLPASAALSVSSETRQESPPVSRCGPKARIAQWEETGRTDEVYDQCIFLDYCQISHRNIVSNTAHTLAHKAQHLYGWAHSKMRPNSERGQSGGTSREARGQPEGSTGQESSNTPASDSSGANTEPHTHTGTDQDAPTSPMNQIARYIFASSKANTACVTTSDLMEACVDDELVDDIVGLLAGRKHPIRVDKEGVGIIAPKHRLYASLPDDEVLARLPRAMNAAFDAAARGSSVQYLDGTRASLLEHLDLWAQGDVADGQEICVLTGKAGTGKTTVASEFARRLSTRGQLGASFFFDRGDDDCGSPEIVLSTLAYQLADLQENIRPHIAHTAREYLKEGAGRRPMSEQAERLLHKVLSRFPCGDRSPERRTPLVIIIDAVDECADIDQGRHRMIELITACTRYATCPLRIFFSSRSGSLTDSAFESQTGRARTHRLSLDQPSPLIVSEADVSKYIHYRLEQLPSISLLTEKHPDVIQKLQSLAGVNFLCAKIMLDLLDVDSPGDRADRLSSLLKEPIDSLSDDSLREQLYNMVMETVIPSGGRAGRDSERLQYALGCLAALQTYLSPKVLHELTLHPEDELIADFRDKLRLVITPGDDQRSGLVNCRPLHSSFVDFLTDPVRGVVDAGIYHTQFALSCLRLLMQGLRENRCEIPASARRPEADLELEQGVRKHVSSALRYASVYFGAHVAGAQGARGRPVYEQLSSTLVKFLRGQGNLLMWLETLACMDRLDVALRTLEQLKTFLNTVTIANLKIGRLRPLHLSNLLDRTSQLVRMHGVEIRDCPLKVYAFGVRAGLIKRRSGAASIARSTVTDIVESFSKLTMRDGGSSANNAQTFDLEIMSTMSRTSTVPSMISGISRQTGY